MSLTHALRRPRPVADEWYRRARESLGHLLRSQSVKFGCDYCADDANRFYGHVTQIASDEGRGRILLRCPRCGALYENSPGGVDETRRLTVSEARAAFPPWAAEGGHVVSIGRPVALDPTARSADPSLPPFLAPPPGAPVYYGFPVLDGVEAEGWRLGLITSSINTLTGDAYVIAPDGQLAGLVWRVAQPSWVESVVGTGARSIRCVRSGNRMRSDLD